MPQVERREACVPIARHAGPLRKWSRHAVAEHAWPPIARRPRLSALRSPHSGAKLRTKARRCPGHRNHRAMAHVQAMARACAGCLTIESVSDEATTLSSVVSAKAETHTLQRI